LNLFEDVLGLFGLQITPKTPKENLSGQLSVGADDGSSTVMNAAATSGAFGTYLDQDGAVKTEVEAIRKYREISLFAEVDIAIQEIVNEAIPQDQDSKLLKLDLDGLEDYSDKIKDIILTEFNEVLVLLNYSEQSPELFKKWYVDGRLPLQIIVDKDHPEDGIKKIIPLDAMNIKKIKDVTTKKTSEGANVIDKIEEYYLYSEGGFGTAKSQSTPGISPTMSLKISKDAIIFATSGIVDNNSGQILSHMHKAIRPINQLRMLEDSTVIYFIARAPERRVFYVDVGNLPKLKAEQYLKDIMNRYRNKMVYDAKTGDVKNDKKYMSMLEDFWMPRRDGGKGTEITSLPGAQNITGYLDSLAWFKEVMYDALNIPKSRLQQESGFSLGQSQTISRDEVKFQKFIDRLRNKFGHIIIDSLKTQLILKGIVNTEEWEDIKPFLKLDFQKDNYFSELKNQEIWQSRFNMIQSVDTYLQKYVSKEWVQRTILMMTDDEIEKMESQISSEADDESCWPDWKLQGQFQSDQQSDMMQQQLSAQPPGQDNFGQQQQGNPQGTEEEYDTNNYQKPK